MDRTLAQLVYCNKNNIFELNDPTIFPPHKEIRIKIEQKYVIPLYVEKLELTEQGKNIIQGLEKQHLIPEPLKTNIYYVQEEKL